MGKSFCKAAWLFHTEAQFELVLQDERAVRTEPRGHRLFYAFYGFCVCTMYDVDTATMGFTVNTFDG